MSAALVTSYVDNGVEEERIWVATCDEDGLYNLVSYFFTEYDLSSFKMIGQKKNHVHPKLHGTVSYLVCTCVP